jgi:integrase
MYSFQCNLLRRYFGDINMDDLTLRLLAFTGARKGEVLALHWSDIDFGNRTITFKRTLIETKGKQLLQTSKTATSRRVISVDEGTLEILKKWRIEQIKAYEDLSIEIATDDLQPIFTRYSHEESKMKFIRLANPNDRLASFFKRHTEFEPITIHGLRHTHASLLFEAGASIKDVQARLGHSDIQTTMNIYTHVTNAAKEKVAHLFENYMDF